MIKPILFFICIALFVLSCYSERTHPVINIANAEVSELSLKQKGYLEFVKLSNPEDINFGLSMPIRMPYTDSTPWQITHYLILEDSIWAEMGTTENKALVPHLINMLEDDKYSWQANLLLYAITKENAIEFESYRPNKYYLWENTTKKADINYWQQSYEY